MSPPRLRAPATARLNGKTTEGFSLDQRTSKGYLQDKDHEWETTASGEYVLGGESRSVDSLSQVSLGVVDHKQLGAPVVKSALGSGSSANVWSKNVLSPMHWNQAATTSMGKEDGWNFHMDPSSWRIRHPRSKTQQISLVLCLNLGTDPPKVIRTDPCARLECWVDPLNVKVSNAQESKKDKASELIGQKLQRQFQSWQTHAQFQLNIDPTLNHMQHQCTAIRKSAQSMRVLMHYNGHGVPYPTQKGEIWVFSEDYLQYMPLPVYDLVNWLGYPCMFTVDCSNAGLLMEYFVKDHDDSDSSCIVMLACSAQETLPIHPDYPADIFTSCLTAPLKIAIRWYVLRNPNAVRRLGITATMAKANLDLWDRIPGRADLRKTPKGELNWIFTSITDSIAWQVLPPRMFQLLFRQDLLVASLFRNFILADRMMRTFSCTPLSHPPLPATWNHPLWEAFDMAILNCLSQLPRIAPDIFEDPATTFLKSPTRPVQQQQQVNLSGPQQQQNIRGGSQQQQNIRGGSQQQQQNIRGGSQQQQNIRGGSQQQQNIRGGSQQQQNIRGGSQQQQNIRGGSQQQQQNIRGGSQQHQNIRGLQQPLGRSQQQLQNRQQGRNIGIRQQQQQVADLQMARIQQTYIPSTFYANQLLSFEVWLNLAEPSSVMPGELPVILQLLLSQTHRIVALKLLARFLDRGPAAVALSLLVGVHPYVLKLLPTITTFDQRAVLVHIWSKILAFDKTCQEDLVRSVGDVPEAGATHFIKLLYDIPVCPNLPTRHSIASQGVGDYHQVDEDEDLMRYNKEIDMKFSRDCSHYVFQLNEKVRVLYILSVIVSGFVAGKRLCLQANMIKACLEQVDKATQVVEIESLQGTSYPEEVTRAQALLRQWAVLALGKLWEGDGFVRHVAITQCKVLDTLKKLLQDVCPGVRTAAVYAQGTLIGTHISKSIQVARQPVRRQPAPPGRIQQVRQNAPPANAKQMAEHLRRQHQERHSAANNMVHPNRFATGGNQRPRHHGQQETAIEKLRPGTANPNPVTKQHTVRFDDQVTSKQVSEDQQRSNQTPPHQIQERPQSQTYRSAPGTPDPEAVARQQKRDLIADALATDCEIALYLLQAVRLDGSATTRREMILAVARLIMDPRHTSSIFAVADEVERAHEAWFAATSAVSRQQPRLLLAEDLREHLDEDRMKQTIGANGMSYVDIWCTVHFISRDDSFPAVQQVSNALVAFVKLGVAQGKRFIEERARGGGVAVVPVAQNAIRARGGVTGSTRRVSNLHFRPSSGSQLPGTSSLEQTRRPATGEPDLNRSDPDFDGVKAALNPRRAYSAHASQRSAVYRRRMHPAAAAASASSTDPRNRSDQSSDHESSDDEDVTEIERNSDVVTQSKLEQAGLLSTVYERHASDFVIPGKLTFQSDLDNVMGMLDTDGILVSRKVERDPLEPEEMFFAKRQRRDAFLLQVKKALREEGWHWARMDIGKPSRGVSTGKSPVLSSIRRQRASGTRRNNLAHHENGKARGAEGPSPLFETMIEHQDVPCLLDPSMVSDGNLLERGVTDLGFSSLSDDDDDSDSPDDEFVDLGIRGKLHYDTSNWDGFAKDKALRKIKRISKLRPRQPWLSPVSDGVDDDSSTTFSLDNSSMIFNTSSPRVGQRRSGSMASSVATSSHERHSNNLMPPVDWRTQKELEKYTSPGGVQPQRYGKVDHSKRRNTTMDWGETLDFAQALIFIGLDERELQLIKGATTIDENRKVLEEERTNPTGPNDTNKNQRGHVGKRNTTNVGTSLVSSHGHLQRVYPIMTLPAGQLASRAPSHMVFHPFESFLISANKSGWLSIWDLSVGKAARHFPNKVEPPTRKNEVQQQSSALKSPGRATAAATAGASMQPGAGHGGIHQTRSALGTPTLSNAASAITHLSWINILSEPLLLTGADDGHFRIWKNVCNKSRNPHDKSPQSTFTESLASGSDTRMFVQSSPIRPGGVTRLSEPDPVRLNSSYVATSPLKPGLHSNPIVGGKQSSLYPSDYPVMVSSFDAFAADRNCTTDAFPGLVAKWQQSAGHLLIGGNGARVLVWDLAAESKLGDVVLPGFQETVITAITCPGQQESGGTFSGTLGGGEGSVVVVGCDNGEIRLYDKRTPTPDHGLFTPVGRIHEMDSDIIGLHIPDTSSGCQLISAHSSGKCCFWDTRVSLRGTLMKKGSNQSRTGTAVESHASSMKACAFHSFAPVIATGAVKPRSSIKLFNMQGTLLTTCAYQEGFMKSRIPPVKSLQFHPFKLLLAAGSSTGSDSTITLYSSSKIAQKHFV